MQKTEFSERWRWMKWTAIGLSICTCCLAAAPGAEQSAQPADFPGHTAASERREQNFNLPGVVDKVLVKEGDTVKAGQLIAQQDTDADEAKLQALDLIAHSDLELKANEAQLAKDKVDSKRKQELLRQRAVSPADAEEAVLQVTVDELKIENAKKDMKKAAFDVVAQAAEIKEKKMFARIDGIVSQIGTHEGELANSETQHPAITIVKNDPLYVEVFLPTGVVKQLKGDQKFGVQYVDEQSEGKWRTASIHFIKPEADKESNYQFVQLEMPNPEGRSSGLQVMVRLPGGIAIASPATGAEVRASQ